MNLALILSVFCHTVAILGTIISLIPALTGNHADLSQFNNDIESIPLRQALLSSHYRLSVAICVGASFPVIFDLIIDLFVKYTRKHDAVRSAVWIMISSLAITNMVIYFYVIPGAHFEIFLSIIKVRFILILLGSLSAINGYCPSIWSWNYNLCGIIIFYTIGQIINSFTPFESNSSVRSSLATFRLVCYSIAYLNFGFLTLLWIRYIINRLRTSRLFSSDDFCCALNVAALIYSASLVNDVTDVNSDAFYLSSQVLRLSFLVIIFVIMNSRAIREKTFMAHVFIDPIELSTTISELHESCNSAVDVLNDLLVYERLDDGTIKLDVVPIAMRAFLEEKQNYFSRQSEPNGIHISLTFETPSLQLQQNNQPQLQQHQNMNNTNNAASSSDNTNSKVFILGDVHKIGHVFRTLLSNAIDVTPRGGTVEINVELVSSSIPSTSTSSYTAKSKIHSRSQIQSNVIRIKPVESSLSSSSPSSMSLKISIKDFGPGIDKDKLSTTFKNNIEFTPGVLQESQKRGLGLW
eukprot:gene13244-28032_t